MNLRSRLSILETDHNPFPDIVEGAIHTMTNRCQRSGCIFEGHSWVQETSPSSIGMRIVIDVGNRLWEGMYALLRLVVIPVAKAIEGH